MAKTGIKINEFSYLLSEKGPLLVISFLGPMTKNFTDVFLKCQAEVIAKSVQYAVVSLHDVTAMDYVGIAEFVRFQKVVRERPSILRICFLKPDFKALLNDRGAIRQEEVTGNLREAIESFSKGTSSGDI